MCLQFTASERMLIQNMVCNLSIKRIPDNVIIKEVYEQTYMTISKVAVKNLDALYTLQQLMNLKSLKEAK